MVIPKKPIIELFAFMFSNNIILKDDLSSSTYSWGTNSFWATPKSFYSPGSYHTTTGWVIDAGYGNDLIDASSSTEKNVLSGGNGVDTILGGSSVDRIDGGEGNDILTGNGGADIFVLSKGKDVIKDFSPTTTIVNSVVIDFEGIASGEGTQILDGYKGLEWGVDAYALDIQNYPGSGYNTVASGQGVGLDWFARGTDFYDPVNDFDFASGDFASAWRNQTNTIFAYDDGVKVGTLTFVSDPTQKLSVDFLAGTIKDQANNVIPGTFTGRFTSIDKVAIDSFDGFQVAMDNLVLNYMLITGNGDKIDVADGFNVAAYIATATNDGNGNAVLTNGNNSLTLVGVAASDISTEWFV